MKTTPAFLTVVMIVFFSIVTVSCKKDGGPETPTSSLIMRQWIINTVNNEPTPEFMDEDTVLMDFRSDSKLIMTFQTGANIDFDTLNWAWNESQDILVTSTEPEDPIDTTLIDIQILSATKLWFGLEGDIFKCSPF